MSLTAFRSFKTDYSLIQIVFSVKDRFINRFISNIVLHFQFELVLGLCKNFIREIIGE